MSQLYEVQTAILEQSSETPVHKGMLRRVVQCRNEDLPITHKCFDSQLEELVQDKLLDKDGQYYSRTQKAEKQIKESEIAE